MAIKALEGIKAVGFVIVFAGSFVLKPLADFGATVVRVESKVRVDPGRMTAPYKDGVSGINRSGVFAYINATNQRSVGIDMTRPEGLEIAKRLIAWADVVVENFIPGVLEKWGLSYEHMKEINPDIILLRSSMQGQTGPHSRARALGHNLSALSGFVHLTGWPDRAPVPPFGVYTDYISPLFATSAVLAALDHRERTGEGQYIDLSQFEAATQFLAPRFLDWFANQRETERAGNSCEFAAPHGVYRCRGNDNWCAIAVSKDKQWQDFCSATGHPEWEKDCRFATLSARKDNEDELNKLVEEWTSNCDAQEVMTLLQGAGVPAGVVKTAGEGVFNDPQLKHRNAFWMLPHPEIGDYPVLGQPSYLSETPPQGWRPTPCLGQDTEMVCREILGMSDEEFVKLLAEGVLE